MINEILSSTIQIKTKDPENLKKLLDLEMQRREYSRSESEVVVDKNKLKINILSKDIVAFKATINNYINILELIKKIYEVEL